MYSRIFIVVFVSFAFLGCKTERESESSLSGLFESEAKKAYLTFNPKEISLAQLEVPDDTKYLLEKLDENLIVRPLLFQGEKAVVLIGEPPVGWWKRQENKEKVTALQKLMISLDRVAFSYGETPALIRDVIAKKLINLLPDDIASDELFDYHYQLEKVKIDQKEDPLLKTRRLLKKSSDSDEKKVLILVSLKNQVGPTKSHR